MRIYGSQFLKIIILTHSYKIQNQIFLLPAYFITRNALLSSAKLRKYSYLLTTIQFVYFISISELQILFKHLITYYKLRRIFVLIITRFWLFSDDVLFYHFGLIDLLLIMLGVSWIELYRHIVVHLFGQHSLPRLSTTLLMDVVHFSYLNLTHLECTS